MKATINRYCPLCLCLAAVLVFSALLTGCDKKTAAEATPAPTEEAAASSAVKAAPEATAPVSATAEPTELPSVTPPAAYPADEASESDIHLITELPASTSDIVVVLPASNSDLD